MPRPAAPRSAPKITPSKSAKSVTRCRLKTACDGTTDDLALRRIVVGGVTMPTLCCTACAQGREMT